MAKPIIAVDIDDVLTLTVQHILDYSNKHWGTNLTIAEYHESFPKMWGVPKDVAEVRWHQFLEQGELGKVKPLPGAMKALQRLSKRFTLIPLTSRRDHLREMTQGWMDRHMGDGLEPVRTMGIPWGKDPHAWKVTKASTVVELGADYLIDDQLKHCLATAEAGKKAVLFGDYPWNRIDKLPEGVVRCADWREVEACFAGIS